MTDHPTHFQTESFLDSTSNIADQLKLVASDAKNIPNGRMSRKFKAAFDANADSGVDEEIKSIVHGFATQAGTQCHLI